MREPALRLWWGSPRQGWQPAAPGATPCPHIYWTNFNGPIGRALLDGTGVNQDFISGAEPQGIAVNASHIYWANSGLDTIGRANLDGMGVNQSFITGASGPEGVAVSP